MGNLLDMSLETIWNGGVAVEIRKNILNGTFSSCRRSQCPYLATAGGSLPAGTVFDAQVARAMEEGRSVLPYGPKVLNLAFDHSCNLSCPSCRQQVSAASGREQEVLDRLCRKIVEIGTSARMVRLSGHGDPFASRAYRMLLDRLHPGVFPSLESVALHTNGLLFDRQRWEELRRKGVPLSELEVSVDAATISTYRENRRGGDFERLMRNLDTLAGLPLRTTLSFVVQQNNFLEMPRFVQMARGFGFKVYFSQLVNWGTFSRQEFARRAVHRAEHPEHGDFLRVLSSLAGEEEVEVGNLAPLLGAERGAQ